MRKPCNAAAVVVRRWLRQEGHSSHEPSPGCWWQIMQGPLGRSFVGSFLLGVCFKRLRPSGWRVGTRVGTPEPHRRILGGSTLDSFATIRSTLESEETHGHSNIAGSIIMQSTNVSVNPKPAP